MNTHWTEATYDYLIIYETMSFKYDHQAFKEHLFISKSSTNHNCSHLYIQILLLLIYDVTVETIPAMTTLFYNYKIVTK